MSNSAAHAELKKLQDRIRGLTDVPKRVAAIVAPELTADTQETFQTKTDLYGTAWKPISIKTIKRGTQSALIRGGKLSRDVDYGPVGDKIRARFSVFYARYFISTGRGTLPMKGRWPAKWDPKLKAATDKAAKDIVEGR